MKYKIKQLKEFVEPTMIKTKKSKDNEGYNGEIKHFKNNK